MCDNSFWPPETQEWPLAGLHARSRQWQLCPCLYSAGLWQAPGLSHCLCSPCSHTGKDSSAWGSEGLDSGWVWLGR